MERARPEPRTTRGHLLWPLLFFAVVALLGTWPLPLRPHALSMSGGGARDGLIFVWDLWWTREALCEPLSSPLFTDLLYHPHGTPLLLHSLALGYGVLSLPFQWCSAGLDGLLLANSALVVGSFWMTGWITYLLALRLTRDPMAALLAGLAFTLSAFHYGNLPRLHILALESLPLVLLLLLRLLERPDRKRALGLGLASAWVFWVSLEYATFLALAGGLLVALEFRRHGPHGRQLPLLLAGGIACLATLPFWLAAARSGLSSASASSPDLKEFFSADLLDLVLPVANHPLWGEPLRRVQQLLHRGHPGFELGQSYAVLVLAVLGARAAWRKRTDLWHWTLLTAFCGLLALGPTLHLAGWRTGVPLPFRVLGWLPLFDQARMPFRFAALFQLGTVVLAAQGAADLWRTSRLRVRWACGLLALVAFETWNAPLPLHPVHVPTPYAHLAGERGALLDWPRAEGEHLLLPTLHQTAHGLPLVQELPWFYPRASEEVRSTARSPAFEALLADLLGDALANLPAPEAEPRLRANRSLLDELELRTVALRLEELDAASRLRAEAGLSRHGFVLREESEGVAIHQRR